MLPEESVKCMVLPKHTLDGPVMGEGEALTVTCIVALQPVAMV